MCVQRQTNLRQAEVPAASIFEFVRGTRSEAKESFKVLDGVDFFDPKNPQIVVEGLQEAEKQFKTTGSLPSYQELARKLDGTLTPQQHLEILGFIATVGDTQARAQWKEAVEASVSPGLEKRVFDNSVMFNEKLFNENAYTGKR